MCKIIKTTLVISSTLSLLIINACRMPNDKLQSFELVRINEIPSQFVATDSRVNLSNSHKRVYPKNSLEEMPYASVYNSYPQGYYNNLLNNQYGNNVNNIYSDHYVNSNNIAENNNNRSNIQPATNYVTGQYGQYMKYNNNGY